MDSTLLLVRLVVGLLLIACSAIAAEAVSLSGYIGSHHNIYPVSNNLVPESAHNRGKSGYIAITEVYPDTPSGAQYHYTVRGGGFEYERRNRGAGFGPETFFIKADQPAGSLSSRSKSSSDAPRFSSDGWRVFTKEELDEIMARDNFRILGLVHSLDTKSEHLVKMLAEQIHLDPKRRISKGFSAEIRFANQSPERVAAEIQNCADWAAKYEIPAMLGWVSWWSGTPLRMPDGEGKTFGDIKYQQICYAPNSEQPEDVQLKELLGDRYNNHYCLSAPNQWSNTPWLTMNSSSLNQYRYKRADEALEALKKISNGDVQWVDNIYLENEPRYWDTLCEDGNPKRKIGELWADFNPLTVAAAKADGVDLNPADGLSAQELSWLFRNVGAYNQEFADALNKSLRSHNISLPVYSHSLQHKYMFPGESIGHAASEWAYVDGTRSGLEGLWMRISDFARIREWGRWANVNREENDGHHTDAHLWDLRVTYMMGADLYNSYNWDSIGAQRVIDYINEFIQELPTVTLPVAEAKPVAGGVVIKTPQKLQAFTSITLPITVGKTREARVRIIDPSGNFLASSTSKLFADDKKVVFDFPNPVEVCSNQSAIVTVETKIGQKDEFTPVAIQLTDCPGGGVIVSLDMLTQRALSLAIIARAEQNRRK